MLPEAFAHTVPHLKALLSGIEASERQGNESVFTLSYSNLKIAILLGNGYPAFLNVFM